MSLFARTPTQRLFPLLAVTLLLALGRCGSDTSDAGQDLPNLFDDIPHDSGDSTLSQDTLPELTQPDTAPSDLANHQILDDADEDGIPDIYDLFPNDPKAPGHVLQNAVYAHTADELWLMQVKTYEMDFVAFFQWPAGEDNPHKMTDIAIDRYGVLYGVSYSGLYVVNANTGECYRVGTLPEPFNALTLVPKGVLDTNRDVMVGISGVGGWYRLDPQGDQFIPTQLGSYGDGYMSSGDAYSIEKVGTFASVNKTGASDDYLVEIDPKTGAVIREVGEMKGLSLVYGLAGWTGRAMAFDESGEIAIVDTKTGEVIKTITDTPKKWWGAGVQTVLPEE